MRGKKNNDVKDAAASKPMLKITTDTLLKQKLITQPPSKVTYFLV